jgi:hypothetical protein
MDAQSSNARNRRFNAWALRAINGDPQLQIGLIPNSIDFHLKPDQL